MKETVKVLLTTYNGINYVEEQIQSILDQENVIVDLEIRDDNSKDNTVKLIQSKFPNIKVNVNIPSTGSAAKNFFKMLINLDFTQNFEYVAFSDQDDIWLPFKLVAAIQKLQNENADLYCSNLTKWDTNDGGFSLLKKDYPQKKFDFLFEGGSAGCTYVFTKSLAIELINVIETMDLSNWVELSHDWFVYFFARSRNYKVVIDGNSYIYYRIHNNNVHGHLNQLNFKTVYERYSKVINGYYQNHAMNYIKYIGKNTETEEIYNWFLRNYFTRNFIIWKYNLQLMRDPKKFFIFALLNLVNFN